MKKVSFWATSRASQLDEGVGPHAEMFGELCGLQTSTFFSIGHSFAALAFFVSRTGMLPERAVPHYAALHACSSDLPVRIAYPCSL
jgi:hypothetical protein